MIVDISFEYKILDQLLMLLAGQKQTKLIKYIQIFTIKQLVMIQSAKPKYRIKYRQCTHVKTHQGQKLNFVCLNQKCSQNSLICSMCRQDVHKGHPIQPLKFYIQQLKKQYEEDKSDYSKQFEALEESRSHFLIKLRYSVQKVAQQFQKLQQQVIERFEQLRNQIIENQSKKNKFKDFYSSLTTQNEDNPEFLIQNYLPAKIIQNLDNFQPIDQLGKKLSSLIYQTRDSMFITNDKKQQIISVALKFQQKLANTVTHIGNIYSQTNHTVNATVQTLSAIASDLLKNFQDNKIKIKITKLKKGGIIYIGAIQKQFFKSLNHKAPVTWINNNQIGKLFFFNSQSVTYGQTTSQLKTFSQNSNIEISMTGNVMKIAMKKNSAEFTLPNNNQYYFFFNLQGQTEIQMNYAKK